MKSQFNILTFGNSNRANQQRKNKIVDTLNDELKLIKRIEYDEFNREVDVKWYDGDDNITDHMHKEYFETENEKGFIETFKNQFQEYIRKSSTKFENGVKHVIDDYTSKSSPEKSYINDFVYDLKGNLQKIITLKK